MFGCPEDDWETGFINLSLPVEGTGHFHWKSNFADVLFLDKNNTDIIGENDELHMLGPYSSNAVQLNFCTREDAYSDQSYSFHGNMCTFKVGTKCSVGMCCQFTQLYWFEFHISQNHILYKIKLKIMYKTEAIMCTRNVNHV